MKRRKFEITPVVVGDYGLSEKGIKIVCVDVGVDDYGIKEGTLERKKSVQGLRKLSFKSSLGKRKFKI